MRRGDIITVAMSGDYGKPRPAIVIQADQLTDADSDTILIVLVTSDLRAATIRRITLLPDPSNGLIKPSQIMVEKIFAIRRERCGSVIGTVDGQAMSALNDAVMFVTGLMDAR